MTFFSHGGKMKLGFIIPALTNVNLDKIYEDINEVCLNNEIDFEVIFAMNINSQSSFTNVRRTFLENEKVRAIKVDQKVTQHELITVAMHHCEKYSAVVIYSAKEPINKTVLASMITSWKNGNKIVFVKKQETGFKSFVKATSQVIYNWGLKIIKVFEDRGAETDIQLLDQEVVATLNQLPTQNRQLRVLDSFVGYATDVVKTQSTTPKNPDYYTKPKGHTYNFAVALGLFGLGFLSLLLAILAATLRWQIGLTFHVLFWGLAIVLLTLSFVFNTRKKLHCRIGHRLDSSDIKNMIEKAEKYNLQN